MLDSLGSQSSAEIEMVDQLLTRGVYANIEDITSSDDKATKVRCWVPASVFTCPVEDDVHVTVAVYHLAAIFAIILQSDGNVSVQFSH